MRVADCEHRERSSIKARSHTWGVRMFERLGHSPILHGRSRPLRSPRSPSELSARPLCAVTLQACHHDGHGAALRAGACAPETRATTALHKVSPRWMGPPSPNFGVAMPPQRGSRAGSKSPRAPRYYYGRSRQEQTLEIRRLLSRSVRFGVSSSRRPSSSFRSGAAPIRDWAWSSSASSESSPLQ